MVGFSAPNRANEGSSPSLCASQPKEYIVSERRFFQWHIQRIIDLWENQVEEKSKMSITRAEYLLDRHTDSPWEGGCHECYYRKPCHKAYGYAKIIIKGYNDDEAKGADNAPQKEEEAVP